MTEKPDQPVESDTKGTEIDLEELFARLDKWKAALRFNRDLQSRYSEEITKWRTLRDQLKDEIYALRDEALEAKAKRDEINAEVAKLKVDRSAAGSQIATLKQKRNEAWNQVKNIRAQLREIINEQRDARYQLRSVYPMLRRVEELDWAIMTTSMPFTQEEAMMDEIENIINEISKTKQTVTFENITLDFEDAKRQIDEFRAAAEQYHQLMIQTVQDGDDIHASILTLVKKSEPHHQRMIEFFNKMDEIRTEEEDAHQKMMENVKELEMLRQGLDEIYNEIRAIEKQISYFKNLEMMEKARVKKAKEEKILDKNIQEALAKYQSGKKLTMIEFNLLLKKGLLKKD